MIISNHLTPEQKYSNACEYYARGGYDNYTECFRLCKEAAEEGHFKAQELLAVLYMRGYGTKRDEEEALRWYKEAAKNGSIEAEKQIAIYEKYRRALEDYRAKISFQDYYEHDDPHIPPPEVDFTACIRLFEEAANEGCVDAQYMLGAHYMWKDEKKEWYWREKAANNGSHPAMRALANHLYAAKDYVGALQWYAKAARIFGDAKCAFRAGLLVGKGYGDVKDYDAWP